MTTLEKKFTETLLTTKFGTFNLRVYNDVLGRETLVLWSGEINEHYPPLVRVHSECLTGDMFGSLHCDCGKQLHKSLQMIKEEGGILIYLRQEGRGIGLFEKIKTYQLQAKGHDTFEANVMLGHRPDARTYEMAKAALTDLGINRIRLITNNPSKVSEIAKLGIEVTECVPLTTRANRHNKNYLATKRRKFKHFFDSSNGHYYYQFHTETPEHVQEISEFIKDKKRDPLLKICVGIGANSATLSNTAEITRIEAILQACDVSNDLIPILHFSFRDSVNILNNATEIKRIWPRIKRLQLNDLPQLEIDTLKKISESFSLDIPLSDENFDIVYKAPFRNLVKKNKSLILLDNSKGQGIKEDKDRFFRKIDVLLAYGLSDIALCGGFGPDNLEIYLGVKRHYRINFSIDAETNLKTNGSFDLEKIKLYLLQLIRSDDPNQQGIEQTKKFLEQHRRLDWEETEINNHNFLVHSKVFHAGYFPSSAWFASELCKLLKDETNFCEVGCGSGVISCLVALSNPQLHVTSTDINPYASENTKLNAERHELSSRISVCNGDVLDNINPKGSFDSIFWALPFGFLDPGINIDLEETQVFDPGYRSIRKFFKTAKQHLTPSGRLLIGFSPELGHQELLEEIANEFSIKLTIISEVELKESDKIRFQILCGIFLN